MGDGALMDSTTAIIGILAVVVALGGYLWLPEWLRNRRMHRELQERHAPWKPSRPMPPVPPPDPMPPKKP
jgi:hypothetical protein